MELVSWLRGQPRQPEFALGWLLAVRRAGSAAAAEKRSTLESGRFSAGAKRLVFAPSGRLRLTEPGRPASQSALGVLQHAYFSMRYGLPSGVTPGDSIKNRTLRSSLGQRGKGTATVTFGTRPYGYPRDFLLRRQKAHKGLIGRPIRLSPSGVQAQRFNPRRNSKISAPKPASISVAFGPGSP